MSERKVVYCDVCGEEIKDGTKPIQLTVTAGVAGVEKGCESGQVCGQGCGSILSCRAISKAQNQPERAMI